MKILAVEFSSGQRSVAVVENGIVLGSATETATRETHALALAEKAINEAGLEREAVECLAIGLGPGSYTGIRAAIALAQGWQLAAGEDRLKLLGISSADCLAAEARARGWSGLVNVVIDAQRGEVYFAAYELIPAGFKPAHPLRLATVEEVRMRASQEVLLAGPEVDRWFPAGKVLFPSAAALGRLAADRGDFVRGEQLEPIYLRETAFVKAPPPRIIPA